MHSLFVLLKIKIGFGIWRHCTRMIYMSKLSVLEAITWLTIIYLLYGWV